MKTPALFVSHGAPTFALQPGRAGALLESVGRALGRPRAIVIISPHWMTGNVEVSAGKRPRTIHDFSGFGAELHEITYPAPGAPDIARRVVEVLGDAGIAAALNESRGLDHGAWVPLRYLYPDADVPVVQVPLPAGLDSTTAYDFGRALRPLGDEGVLVIGSGSLTHNLYEFRGGAQEEAEYAQAFTRWVRQAVLGGDRAGLLRTLEVAPHARRAHPTPEHFLPLLIALGAAGDSIPATVLDGGIRDGVLSMESYVFGRDLQRAITSPGCDPVATAMP